MLDEVTPSGTSLQLLSDEVGLEAVACCILGITSLLFPQSTHFSYNILHFLPYSPQLSQNKSQLWDPSVQKTLRMLLRNRAKSRAKHTCKFIFSRVLFLQSFLHCPAPESSGQPSEINHRPESPVSSLSWTAFPAHKGAEQILHLIISAHTGTMNTKIHIFEQRPKSQFPFTYSPVAVKRINCQQWTLHLCPDWSCSLTSVQLSGFMATNDLSELIQSDRILRKSVIILTRKVSAPLTLFAAEKRKCWFKCILQTPSPGRPGNLPASEAWARRTVPDENFHFQKFSCEFSSAKIWNSCASLWIIFFHLPLHPINIH